MSRLEPVKLARRSEQTCCWFSSHSCLSVQALVTMLQCLSKFTLCFVTLLQYCSHQYWLGSNGY